jgi:hypothetical protein
MRVFACLAAVALPLIAASVTQAGCLKADAEDQVAEGRLAIVRIEIPDYKLKEQAFMLQLAAEACLDVKDKDDEVEPTKRIHVFSTDEGMRKRMRGLVGQVVRVRGVPFGQETIHHHAPIVMSVTAIEPMPKQ